VGMTLVIPIILIVEVILVVTVALIVQVILVITVALIVQVILVLTVTVQFVLGRPKRITCNVWFLKLLIETRLDRTLCK
jgi:hypothetical protein